MLTVLSSAAAARTGLMCALLFGSIATALIIPEDVRPPHRTDAIEPVKCSTNELGAMSLLLHDPEAQALCFAEFPQPYSSTVTVTDYITSTLAQGNANATVTATVSNSTTITIAEIVVERTTAVSTSLSLSTSSTTTTSTTTTTTTTTTTNTTNSLGPNRRYTRSPSITPLNRLYKKRYEVVNVPALMTAAPAIKNNFCACVAQQDECCPPGECHYWCDCNCARTTHITSISWAIQSDNVTSTVAVTSVSTTFTTTTIGTSSNTRVSTITTGSTTTTTSTDVTISTLVSVSAPVLPARKTRTGVAARL